MAEDSSDKIEILNTKIIAPGYDLSAFLGFLGEQKKPNGDDIESWAFDTFKEQVDEYIKQTPLPSSEELISDVSVSQTSPTNVTSVSTLPEELIQNTYSFYGPNFPKKLNDPKRVLRKLQQISEAERASMNEYGVLAIPSEKTIPNELNSQSSLKITVSE